MIADSYVCESVAGKTKSTIPLPSYLPGSVLTTFAPECCLEVDCIQGNGTVRKPDTRFACVGDDDAVNESIGMALTNVVMEDLFAHCCTVYFATCGIHMEFRGVRDGCW